ncbi:MAG: RES family NAD+ phosphorylase [Marinomonas sp.]
MDNFKRIKSYEAFCEEVKSTNRHFLSEKALDFLEWLYKIALEDHNQALKKESTNVYRARVGAEYPECLKSHDSGDGKEIEWVEPNGYIYPRSYSSDYFPISGRLGSGGRANPEGIAFLYVASTPEIAISEVRPFINHDVSVALMRLKRDLKIADFSMVSDDINFSYAKYSKEIADKLSQFKVIDSVIRDVSNAFSRPVFEQSKTIEYLPTQVIAEYFHSKGFDGIGFRSQFETAHYKKDRDELSGEISVQKKVAIIL